MWTTTKFHETICHILKKGSCGPIFLWLYFPHRGNELEHMEEVLDQVLPGSSLTIVACQVQDWNRDLSPWAAPGMMDDEIFPGGGPDLLRRIEAELLPWMRELFPVRRADSVGNFDEKIYIMGYSLAGLFALWSLYESDLFDGAVCCSSSLWIDGWAEFIEDRTLKKKSEVYLSLGGKEERTGNPRMAQVGNRTRMMEKVLKADPNAARSVLDWNSGGHFADSVKRMVKGIAWIMQ